jgi:NADH-quinone oxidoreductase subunit N
VAHGGYTLLGLVAGSRDGFSATLFYVVVYAITLVGAFGVVAVVRSETGGDDLKDFSGLARRAPLLAGCMAVFMLSLAGVPPLAGFFGKFYLFSAALRASGDHGLFWLIALAFFGSFMSLYYYLIVLKAIFVDETSLATPSPSDRPSSRLLHRITVAVLAAAILFFGIMPNVLAERILAAVP